MAGRTSGLFFFQTRQEVSSVICLSGLNRATLIIIYNHQDI